MIFPQPKGKTRQQLKGRKDRAEQKQEKLVREICVRRDGHCRLAKSTPWADLHRAGVCDGPSEWAHLGAKKRARTRKMAPEIRHTSSGSLMLCRQHHHDYDAGRIVIVGADADKVLAFFQKGAA